MSAILADFQCRRGHVFEALVDHGKKPKCPECGANTRRVYSVSKAYLGNQDCNHVRSAADVLIDKDDRSREATELKAHPTRDNLEKFCKIRKLARMDYTEHGGPPVWHRPPEPDLSNVRAEVARRHFERKRIEVGHDH